MNTNPAFQGLPDEPEARRTELKRRVMSGEIRTHTADCECYEGQVGCTRPID